MQIVTHICVGDTEIGLKAFQSSFLNKYGCGPCEQGKT